MRNTCNTKQYLVIKITATILKINNNESMTWNTISYWQLKNNITKYLKNNRRHILNKHLFYISKMSTRRYEMEN